MSKNILGEQQMSKCMMKIASFCIGFVLVLLSINHTLSQTKGTNFLDEKINLSIKTGNIFQISSGLAFDRVPIGFEGATDFDIKSDVRNIKIENGTLREILDSIIKQEPKYTWEAQDGIVNIYPIQSRDEILKVLLETNIKDFWSRKETGKPQISRNINNSEEVSKFLDSKKVRLLISTRTKPYAEEELIPDTDLSNTNLRKILNKIVLENKDSKFWSVWRSTNEERDIFLVF
jgi:hypothetical protein